ncbi:MAG: AAA family ATPase [Thermoplasmata archaeon]
MADQQVANEAPFSKPEEVIEAFEKSEYVADRSIAMAVYLSMKLGKPLLVEGEPGCGKTDIARALSEALDTDLIRLQCYEGLDAESTLYEWNYPKQLLAIRLQEKQKDPSELEAEIFSEKFLLRRPLLKALNHDGPKPPTLLIDEIDRADEEFEGLLLEFLSEFQVTIPEIGTFRAERVPFVIITSNRTRELSDALKRRCLYLYIDYPSWEKELTILRRRVPELDEGLAEEVLSFVQRVRTEEEVLKRPGISETLDWVAALLALGVEHMDKKTLLETLGFVAKEAEDLRLLEEKVDLLLRS